MKLPQRHGMSMAAETMLCSPVKYVLTVWGSYKQVTLGYRLQKLPKGTFWKNLYSNKRPCDMSNPEARQDEVEKISTNGDARDTCVLRC